MSQLNSLVGPGEGGAWTGWGGWAQSLRFRHKGLEILTFRGGRDLRSFGFVVFMLSCGVFVGREPPGPFSIRLSSKIRFEERFWSLKV